ncbi:SDR family NAD(P)-dependent oxidoreductase [Dyadobacter diqingensis]|uniref:SDR family NAD(P)-dependent oxidoreductase n=1 Tax=Dyadobacter diqingensis TaxID=2938121 RepID=UPI0020C18E6B|nr:glucose 1-dehydrogenase [Dyadobacter diqingensis]
MSSLKGKVAIITGASKGIGAGIAKRFAAAGADVVVNYATSKEGADAVVKQIKDEGGSALAVQGDVGNAADVKRLFEETKTAFGKLDILVNNAGTFKFEPLEAVTEEIFHWQFNTNVLGPILTIQESVKYFDKDGGSIINISSIASVNPVLNSVVYAASKSAVDALTYALAKELGPKKIRVNAIAPGGVETEGTHQAGIMDGPDKVMAAATPLGRFGQPDDIARVAVFLASEDASWVTGERITVSGGFK